MPTILEDIHLQRISYTDDLSNDPQWQVMQAAGWKHIGRSSDLLEGDIRRDAISNGFSADAFLSPTGEVIIANRGTEPTSVKDLWADVQLAFHDRPGQADSAKDFLVAVQDHLRESGKTATAIHVTGHSLGGYLCQDTIEFTKNILNVAITGFGLADPGVSTDSPDNPNFLHLQPDSDLVHHAGGAHLGVNITYDSIIPPYSPLQAHFSDNAALEIALFFPKLSKMAPQEFLQLTPAEQHNILNENIYSPEQKQLLWDAATSLKTNEQLAYFFNPDPGTDPRLFLLKNFSASIASDLNKLTTRLEWLNEHGDKEERKEAEVVEKEISRLNAMTTDLEKLWQDIDTGQIRSDGSVHSSTQSSANTSALQDGADSNSLDKPSDQYVKTEAEQKADIKAGEVVREADLQIMQAQESFSAAVASGNTLEIVRTGLEYYSSLEKRAGLGVDGRGSENGSISKSTEALMDSVASAIRLGQAIDSGDGLDIAGQSIRLLQDIDKYVFANSNQQTHLLGDASVGMLGMGAAGIGLAQAIETGNGLAIAQSSVKLLEEINNCTTAATTAATAAESAGEASTSLSGASGATGTTGQALAGIGSALGLVMNITQLEDVFASKDAGAIACTVASTVNNAINTYNAVANLAGMASISCGSIVPGLGFVAAGIQLAQGNVVGAAFSAASAAVALAVAAGLMSTGIGAIAGLAIMAIQMLVCKEDPPQATASFTLGEDGQIHFQVSGDKAMRSMAENNAPQFVELMDAYRKSGGRLEIDGTLPSLNVVGGGDSSIAYRSSSGGRAIVIIDDMSKVLQELQTVLIARDRGERLESAVRVARDVHGDIDLAQVDAIMAGHGFGKNGITYTYGETGDVRGLTTGSGVFRGGGNIGPEGQHFTATHMQSLPLREEQLPSQRMGEILKIIGLNNTFSGAGSELLAMALGLAGGVAGLAAPAMAAAATAPFAYSGRPLTAKEIAAGEADGTSRDPEAARQQAVDGNLATGASQHPLSGIAPTAPKPWLEALPSISILGAPPETDPHHWLELRSDGSRSGWRGENRREEVFLSSKTPVPTATANGTEPAPAGAPQPSRPSESFSGYRLSSQEIASLPVGPIQAGGPVFRMSGDGILRFLLPELTENQDVGAYLDTAQGHRLISFGEAVGGRVYQDANGDFRFAPAAGFSGTASFAYLVEDAVGNPIEKRATIIVEKVNGAPVLVDDHFHLAEGEPFVLSRLLVNDHDPDNDVLILDHVSGLANGEVALLNGQLAYLPGPGYHGEVTFTYWAKDQAHTYPLMAQATLTYTDLPSPPDPGDDRFLILEGNDLVVFPDRLLENDREYDGQSLALVGLGAASHGSVGMLADGSIRFVPETDYSGTGAGFAYTVGDSSGLTASAWVEVEIQDQRKAPVITATTRPAILEDTPLTFTPEEIATFVHDPDGDRLHFDIVTNVQGGRFVTSAGYYTFIPEENYSGPASFDYVVNDNHRGTAFGSLSFAILPVNDPIVIGVDSLSTSEDQVVSVAIADLLSNDSDPDGATITFAGLGATSHGAARIDGDRIVFTPEADYGGSEAGYTYMVGDDQGLTSSGWVSVAVSPVDDLPFFTTLQLSLEEDQPLVFDQATLARCADDVDGDELRVTAVDNPVGGSVSEVGGLFTFIPDPDYYGPGQMRVTVSDGSSEVTGTLELTIAAVDDPALLPTLTLHTIEEEAVTITSASLLVGAMDVDGPLRFIGVGDAMHGRVVDEGYGNLTFTPDSDYFGNAAGFTYLVEDALGGRTVGRVAVEVANVNDRPQLIADTLTLDEDHPLVFDQATLTRFLDNRDGDQLTLESLSAIDGGTVSRDGDLYTYTPEANFHGSARLALTATDNHGATVSGIINLDILSVDDPTRFGLDILATDEDQPVTVAIADLLANDSDDDGPLAFVDIPEVRHGTVTRQGDELCFLPDRNYFGDQAGFAYRVEDSEGHQASAWVTVRVDNIPDAPRIVADHLHWQEDLPLAFTPEEIAKFIVDDDGEPMRLITVSEVESGLFEDTGGLFTFVPNPNHYGEAAFVYHAANASNETIDGRLAIFLAPVNDLPTVMPLALSGVEDQIVSLTVDELLARGSDIEDGSDLRFGGIESSLGGDVFVDEQGRVHFLPERDFFGDAAFTYRLLDSEGGVSRGVVGIAIAGENDGPVARDDQCVLAWSNNAYENVYLPTVVTANDYDVDGDPLRVVAVGAAEFGTVSLDGTGRLHYVAPADRWVGIDRFIYQIDDGHGQTATATAWLDVRINTSPDVYGELLFTSEDVISTISQQELLANDSDIDGDAMAIIAVDQAEHCQVSLQADGSILFIPELNYNNLYPGQAYFRYTVSDGISEPVWTYAFFDIEPVNDAPILCGERIFGAVEDNSFSFAVADLMQNDSDVEMASPYESDSIHFAGVWGAGHGSISWDQASNTIFYVPDPNFCGVETFNYTVFDSHGASSSVTSEIYVEPVNDLPVVQDDIASTAEDSVWNLYSIAGLVANDFDVDGDVLSIKNPRVIEGDAEVTISGGDLKVKPAFREDRVVVAYTVSDGNGGEVESRLTIPDIREHNFAPLFSGLYAIAWKNSYTVWFNFHAYDPNGGNTWGDSGEIVGISCSAPSEGSLTDEGYTFKFKGDTDNATLTLTVADQAGASGTIFIEVGRLARGDGNYHYTPVVLDLDGDGIELLDLSAGVSFDWNGDGRSVASGWVGGDDGFLAYDFDGDGAIRDSRELAFKDYDPQATTDLEGLRAFDSIDNDRLDWEDQAWKNFGVWQDGNSDGTSDPGEFTGLDHLGIASISLVSDEQMRMEGGNIVFGMGSYEKIDGTAAELGDVGLQKEATQPQLFIYPFEDKPALVTSDTITSEEITGHLLDSPAQGVDDATTIDHLVQQLLSDIAAGSVAESAVMDGPAELLAVDVPLGVVDAVEEQSLLLG